MKRTNAAGNAAVTSARMKAKNPMAMPGVREQVKTSLRAMGWKPTVRKGNGTGPTVYQALLASALGWEMEIAVKTKKPRGSGYPTSYKLDIANEVLLIGVEVDGFSHQALSRQAQDIKKDALLRLLGWTVLRFTNKQVETDLAGCVQTVLSTISKSKETTTTSPTAS